MAAGRPGAGGWRAWAAAVAPAMFLATFFAALK